jgi:hypothetical protein
MASIKQIHANRRNAQKSTGPRTAQGKAVSSMNALSSGIDAKSTVIPSEDPAALAALTSEFLAEHRPQSATERALVDTLITCEWFLRRLRLAEAQLWEASRIEREKEDSRTEIAPLAYAFATTPTGFAHLWRRMDSLHRRFHEALHELRRVRAARASVEASEPIDAACSSEQIGFVPQAEPSLSAVSGFQMPIPPCTSELPTVPILLGRYPMDIP